ncbi:MAG: glycosyltransferase family 4 protein [Deltaproteobacteria bacterium]|nr:glycosyltransferase family 4 protein [Deltaproteobacteria bacterium]
MKVIAYSLYGDKKIYTEGMLRNIELAPVIYPGWSVWIYFNETVPQKYIERYRQYGHVELKDMTDSALPGMMWRFLPEAEVFISRDTDSRLTVREKECVEEWLASDKTMHVMRDHPAHHLPVLGGMWGIKKNHLDMGNSIRTFLEQFKERDNWQYGIDQEFLRAIYRFYQSRDSVLAHDSLGLFPEGIPFPNPLGPEFHFVGEVFNEDEERRQDHYQDWLACAQEGKERLRDGSGCQVPVMDSVCCESRSPSQTVTVSPGVTPKGASGQNMGIAGGEKEHAAKFPNIDRIPIEYPRSQWSIKNGMGIETIIGRLDRLADPQERAFWSQNGLEAFKRKYDLLREGRTINILMVAADTYGCGYARIQRPAKYLNRLPQIIAFPTITVPVELILWSHIIVWQRQHGDEAYKSLELARKLNKVQIFEIDDNLHAIPKDNPAHHFYNRETASYRNMLRWMQGCDLVTVTKEGLGEFYRELAGIRYAVLPNCIDFEEFPAVDLAERPNDKVRIGWAGSETHYGDLRILANVFRRLKKLHGNRIEFVLMGSDGVYRQYEKVNGSGPEIVNDRTLKVKKIVGDVLKGVPREFHPFVETEDYARVLCDLKLDIAVIPLTPSKFNLTGKSNLKYLEMSAAKIPCVLSKNTVYEEVQHGENGFLAANEQEWLQYLSLLVQDRALRCRIAANAYRYVRENYDFSRSARQWLKTYMQAVGSKHDAMVKRRTPTDTSCKP